jgi:hypothetical protein
MAVLVLTESNHFLPSFQDTAMQAYKTELRWAVIFATIGLLWVTGEKLIGLHETENIGKHAIYSGFFAIPAIAVYVFALLDKKRRDYQGTITYKQAFISGCIVTLGVVLLSPLTQAITTYGISPEFFPNAIAYSVQHGMMPETEAREYFTLKNYLVQNFMFGAGMGIVTSIIVAFFIKSKQTSGS